MVGGGVDMIHLVQRGNYNIIHLTRLESQPHNSCHAVVAALPLQLLCVLVLQLCINLRAARWLVSVFLRGPQRVYRRKLRVCLLALELLLPLAALA